MRAMQRTPDKLHWCNQCTRWTWARALCAARCQSRWTFIVAEVTQHNNCSQFYSYLMWTSFVPFTEWRWLVSMFQLSTFVGTMTNGFYKWLIFVICSHLCSIVNEFVGKWSQQWPQPVVETDKCIYDVSKRIGAFWFFIWWMNNRSCHLLSINVGGLLDNYIILSYKLATESENGNYNLYCSICCNCVRPTEPIAGQSGRNGHRQKRLAVYLWDYNIIWWALCQMQYCNFRAGVQRLKGKSTGSGHRQQRTAKNAMENCWANTLCQQLFRLFPFDCACRRLSPLIRGNSTFIRSQFFAGPAMSACANMFIGFCLLRSIQFIAPGVCARRLCAGARALVCHFWWENCCRTSE